MEKDEVIGFLKAGKYRIRIMEEIKNEKYLTPKELSERLDILFPQVSRTLTKLSKKGLIKCTTPEHKKGRIYRLTNLGRETLKV